MTVEYYVLINIKTKLIQRINPNTFEAEDTDEIANWAWFYTAESALQWRDKQDNWEDLFLRKATVRLE